MSGSSRALARHAVVAIFAAAVGFAIGRAGPPGDVDEPVPPLAVGSAGAGATSPATPGTADALRSAEASGRSSPRASASAASVGSAALARARDGDLPALKALDARGADARTIDEALALEAGHAALARREGQRLVDDVVADRSLLDDPTTMAHAVRLALDPAVAPVLLAGLAPIDHPVVPDLLFDLASRGEPGGRLVLLAEDLLRGTARARASPALEVALRVRAARSCERIAALLPAVGEGADDRVLPILARVDVRTGCGRKRADDCYGCLRDPDQVAALEAARAAARARPFTAPWRPQRGSAQQRKPVE